MQDKECLDQVKSQSSQVLLFVVCSEAAAELSQLSRSQGALARYGQEAYVCSMRTRDYSPFCALKRDTYHTVPNIRIGSSAFVSFHVSYFYLG